MKIDFEFSKYEKHPTEKGMLRFVRMATYQELDDAFSNYLKKCSIEFYGKTHNVYDVMDYISISGYPRPKAKDQIPSLARVLNYVVEGGSEGYYFHIQAQTSDGTFTPLIMCKTLCEDAEKAIEMNTHITRFLLSIRG